MRKLAHHLLAGHCLTAIIFAAYQRYAIFGDGSSSVSSMPALGLSVLPNPYNLPWRYFAGNLGMSGQTAYYALKDVSNPKPVSGFLVQF